jgi:LPS sulfotransferase NodH
MPGLAVIARQRSGTNFLRSLIAASSNLTNLGEVFDIKAKRVHLNFFHFRDGSGFTETAPRETEECIDELCAFFTVLHGIHPHHVIDIKYDQTLLSRPTCQSPAEPPPVFRALERCRYGVVHLVRENVCASIVSHQVAAESGVWHVPRAYGDPVSDVKLHIDPLQFLADVARREREIALFDAFCAELSLSMRVRYEALDAAGDDERAGLLRDMCRIGGGSFTHVGHPAFRKSLGNWLDYIENRAEVEAALAGRPGLARYLATTRKEATT